MAIISLIEASLAAFGQHELFCTSLLLVGAGPAMRGGDEDVDDVDGDDEQFTASTYSKLLSRSFAWLVKLLALLLLLLLLSISAHECMKMC